MYQTPKCLRSRSYSTRDMDQTEISDQVHSSTRSRLQWPSFVICRVKINPKPKCHCPRSYSVGDMDKNGIFNIQTWVMYGTHYLLEVTIWFQNLSKYVKVKLRKQNFLLFSTIWPSSDLDLWPTDLDHALEVNIFDKWFQHLINYVEVMLLQPNFLTVFQTFDLHLWPWPLTTDPWILVMYATHLLEVNISFVPNDFKIWSSMWKLCSWNEISHCVQPFDLHLWPWP